MPSDYTESSFSECPCPYVSSVTKAKALPSPDIALRKVVLNEGGCTSTDTFHILRQNSLPHSQTLQVYTTVNLIGIRLDHDLMMKGTPSAFLFIWCACRLCLPFPHIYVYAQLEGNVEMLISCVRVWYPQTDLWYNYDQWCRYTA